MLLALSIAADYLGVRECLTLLATSKQLSKSMHTRAEFKPCVEKLTLAHARATHVRLMRLSFNSIRSVGYKIRSYDGSIDDENGIVSCVTFKSNRKSGELWILYEITYTDDNRDCLDVRVGCKLYDLVPDNKGKRVRVYKRKSSRVNSLNIYSRNHTCVCNRVRARGAACRCGRW